MNNYWYTNYKADQAGISSYTHSIIPHLAYVQLKATQHGIESSQPLILKEVALTDQSKILPPFTLINNNVYVSSIKPAKDNNALIVRLYNPGNTTEEVSLILNPLYKNVFRSSPFEEQGEKLDKIKLLPYEIVTVLLSK